MLKKDEYGMPDPRRLQLVGTMLTAVVLLIPAGVLLWIAIVFKLSAPHYWGIFIAAVLWIAAIIALLRIMVLSDQQPDIERNKATLRAYVRLTFEPRFLNWQDRRGCDGELVVPSGGIWLDKAAVNNSELVKQLETILADWCMHNHPRHICTTKGEST